MRENSGMADQHGESRQAEPGPGAGADHGAQRPKARDLNQLIRYTMWSVFRVSDRTALDLANREALAVEVTDLCEQAAGKDLVTRGCYDLQGMRADADLMFWWIAPAADDLQEMYARFRRTRLGRACEPVWSAMALRRRNTSACTRSSVPTSGTCSTTASGARCWPSTARWRATTRTCGRTPSRPSRSATTSGCWRSRPTNCTGSWT